MVIGCTGTENAGNYGGERERSSVRSNSKQGQEENRAGVSLTLKNFAHLGVKYPLSPGHFLALFGLISHSADKMNIMQGWGYLIL